MKPIESLILQMPKADLHVQLDGSLRPQTFLELADQHGVEVPANCEADLFKTIFKEKYVDLEDYLRGFAFTCAVLADEEAIERVAYELCVDSLADGVYYLEIRFAPQLFASPQADIVAVLKAAANGIQRAETEWQTEKSRPNSKLSPEERSKPPFRAALIACALRFFKPAFSQWFAQYFDHYPEESDSAIFARASLDLVQDCLRARDQGIPIVGIDLAGVEQGYEAKDHSLAFGLAHQAELGITLHAGEAAGPASIHQALTDCHAQRLGHATWVFGSKLRQPVAPYSPRSVSNPLVEELIAKNIGIEVCLTSNLQTLPEIKDLKHHPLTAMMEQGMAVTLCSDNLLMSRTTLSGEYLRAQKTWQWSPDTLHQLTWRAFEQSFFPGTPAEKTTFLRAIRRFSTSLNQDAEKK